jgi:hypothetical protein
MLNGFPFLILTKKYILLPKFNIFRTVHLHIILVGKQLDAQFFLQYIYLFKSSTCFKQLCAHPQGDNCMNTTSGIITLC